MFFLTTQTTNIAQNMILNKNTLNENTINHNKTCEDLHFNEPPLLKQAKHNLPVPTQKSKVNDYSESNQGHNSTASSRKVSIDNSQCSHCSEFLCLNSLCGDCAYMERNVLSEAASNLSEAMSSIENSSQIDADEISEVWELSSICTENSLQSKKKKIVKYLHIKSMTNDSSNEDYSPVCLGDVLPLFEQIERSSRLSEINQAVNSQNASALLKYLLSSQICFIQDIQKSLQVDIRSEESKCGGFRCQKQNNSDRDSNFNFSGVAKVSNIISEKTAQVRKSEKHLTKQKRQNRDNDSHLMQQNGGSPSSCSSGNVAQKCCSPMTTTFVSKLGNGIEEETQAEDPQGENLPAYFHSQDLAKPPMLRKQAVVFISFTLMNQRILESAKKRANAYLERLPKTSSNFDAMQSMVTEVYRVLLMPEEALQLYLSQLSWQQRAIEGQAILHRLCPQINRHQNLVKALQKIRKFYQV